MRQDGVKMWLPEGVTIKRYFEHIRMPYSEVMMFMRLADKTLSVAVLGDDEDRSWVAQIVDGFGRPYSAPVLLSEAGLQYVTDRNKYIDAFPWRPWK